MPAKLRFGVLGVARIATVKVIPAMQSCEHCEITGIASRDGLSAPPKPASMSFAKSPSP
jgi:hypothetical protein